MGGHSPSKGRSSPSAGASAPANSRRILTETPEVPPSESIPYITSSALLASQPGDDIAFANPDAYHNWREGPPDLPSRNLHGTSTSSGPSVPSSGSNHAASHALPGAGGPSQQIRALHTSQPQEVKSRRYPPFTRGPEIPQKLLDQSEATVETGEASGSNKAPQARIRQSAYEASLPSSKWIAPSSQSRELQIASPQVTLPSPEYLALSKPSKQPQDSELTPKLLIMDLNGALIYRSKSNASSRTSYPRPYLSCLLDYLFLPEPDAPSDSSIPIRPWSAFVWSSAQPHNVRSMVETAFGKYSETVWNTESRQSRQDRQKRGEGRLLGVWARDKMGLDESDYRNKVQTFKDLRQVIQHVKQSRPSDYKFDLENVVLLDDSPLKAIHQPWNQIVIPEYDKPEFTAARSAATRMQYGKNAEEAGMDSTLLAVIGMLEEMRNIPNIPAWIRSGGLIKTTSTESDNDEEYVDSLLTEDRAPTIKDLPSHDTFNHWFKEQKVVSYWTQRGREALERKGIAVEHGIDLEGRSASPMSRTPPAAHFQSAADLRQRRWSPSRPVSPSFDQPDEVEGSAGRSRLAPSARSPSPTSSFSRRSFATMAQALPDTTTHQLVPAASNSWNAAPGPSVAGIPNAAASRGPQSRASKAPVPRTERWRTFSALEVSRYLSDIADRSFGASYSLQQATNQSQILRTAAQTLARYHEDVEIRRPAPSGHWEGELCVKCLKWVGGLQIGVRGQEAHQRAMAAGFNNALFMAQQHELATASGSEMATKPLTKKQRKRAKQAAAVAALASSTSSKKKKTAAAGAAATKKVTAVTEASRKKAKTDQVKGKGKKNLSNNGENAISSEVPNADSQVTLSFGNNGQTGGGEAGSSGIRDPAWKKKKKIREDRLTALAKNTATKHESDPSTPERIAKAVDRLDSSAESPPVTRSNPRRSATNVEAIRAEARLDAELYGRKSSRSRSRF